MGHPHLRARGSWWPVLDSDGLTPVWPGLCTSLPRAWGSQLGDSDSPGLLLGPAHLGSLEVLFPQDRPVLEGAEAVRCGVGAWGLGSGLSPQQMPGRVVSPSHALPCPPGATWATDW